MHTTAMSNGRIFFGCYGKYYALNKTVKVIDVGSLDVNGSLRSAAPKTFDYVGVDFAAGKGVDIVLDDPYRLPFESESADIVLSSSCFEHSEMFWLVFLEIMRVLRPRGLFYLNVPSNGSFHRYPVDCWRFYPDSGKALVAWANRNGMKTVLLESYTSLQSGDIWNDFVAVFLKDRAHLSEFKDRIVHSFKDFNNGVVANGKDYLNYSAPTEDQRKLAAISQIASNQIRVR